MPKATQTPSGATRLSHSPSPIKAAAKRARQPRHCSKCEGRPLRVMCKHSRTGRLHIQNERERVLLSGTGPRTSTQITDMDTSAARFSPTPLEQPHQDPLSPKVPDTNAFSAQTLAETVLRSQSVNDPSPTPLAPPSPPTAPVPPSTIFLSSGTVQTSGKRLRAIASNPIFGHVEGVYRGEVLHSIHRGHALPKQINDRAKIQKHFLESANSILTRCEDLATQTDCWLFVGMQHATARAAPLHYASPRIRRDAPDAISDFSGEFCTTMNNLMDARRRDTFEVQQDLHALEVEKGNLEQELVSLRNKAVSDSALLRRYKEMFGTPIA